MTLKERFAPGNGVENGEDETRGALSNVLAKNLRQLRQKRGFSLERLAKISQVSRAMLGQIETGKSAPTINTVGLIAQALKVSISTLLTADMPLATVVRLHDTPPAISSAEERRSSRVIAAWRDLSGAEVHEVSLAMGRSESFPAASDGIKKGLIVTAGIVGIEIGDEPSVTLTNGDAVIFCANNSHEFRNLGSEEAKALVVIAGVDPFNWQEEQ